MAENRVVVGVFAKHTFAEQALEELQNNGFRNEQIGFLFRDGQGTPTEKLVEPGVQSELDNSTATDAMTGSIVGGVVGAVAALVIPGLGPAIAGGILTTLSGLVVGAAAGGLIGALIHMGIPEEQAHYYEQELYQGRTIVIVQADERPMDAFAILKRNRGYDAEDTERVQDQSLRRKDDPEATVKLDDVS